MSKLCSIFAIIVLASASLLGAADAPGCKDHPLFTRMQNMTLTKCRFVDFDRFVFKTGKAKGDETAVEGKHFEIYKCIVCNRYEIVETSYKLGDCLTVKTTLDHKPMCWNEIPKDQRYESVRHETCQICEGML